MGDRWIRQPHHGYDDHGFIVERFDADGWFFAKHSTVFGIFLFGESREELQPQFVDALADMKRRTA